MRGERVLNRLASRMGAQHRLAAIRYARGPFGRYRNALDDAALTLVMAAAIRPDSHCIDVGCNEGVMLQRMVELAPRGRHLAFEPIEEHARQLRQQFRSVDVRAVALGDRNGSAQFMVRSHTALSSLETVPDGEDPDSFRGEIHDGAERRTVAVRRLDDELPEGFAPSFIKIDVEGVEHAVLEGAQATLARHRPVVAVEHSLGAAHHNYPIAGIHDLLAAARLRIFDADGRGPYSRAELESQVMGGRMWFYFAFPE